MKRVVFFALSVLFLLTSCVKYDDISVDDVRVNDIKFESTSKIIVKLSIKVDNGTKKNLTLKNAAFDIETANSVVFANFQLLRAAQVKPMSDDYYPVEAQVNISDLLALISYGIDIRNPDIDKIFATGTMKLKAGCMVHTLKVKHMSLQQLRNSIMN